MPRPSFLLMSGLLIPIFAGSLSLPTAGAQEYAIETVMRQLDALLELEEDDGLQLHNYIVGKLDNGETDAWTMHLYEGVSYDIWGVCDDDCSDVDLRIYSEEDGSLISEDVETDNTPLGIIQPEKNGRYTIELDMYECAIEPCFFGIGIFTD
jgi:hypothetical protein